MKKSENQGQSGSPDQSTYASVNSPSHYTSHPSGVECIDIVKHFNYCCGNVIKYLWRCGIKDGETSMKDLLKAERYIKFEIARVRDEEASRIDNKQK